MQKTVDHIILLMIMNTMIIDLGPHTGGLFRVSPKRYMAKRLLKVFIIDAVLSDPKAHPDNTDTKGKEGYYFTLEVLDNQEKTVGEYRFKSKAVRSYSIGWKQNCQFTVPNQGLGTQYKSLKSVYCSVSH